MSLGCLVATLRFPYGNPSLPKAGDVTVGYDAHGCPVTPRETGCTEYDRIRTEFPSSAKGDLPLVSFIAIKENYYARNWRSNS